MRNKVVLYLDMEGFHKVMDDLGPGDTSGHVYGVDIGPYDYGGRKLIRVVLTGRAYKTIAAKVITEGIKAYYGSV